jgi:hypothetical protein
MQAAGWSVKRRCRCGQLLAHSSSTLLSVSVCPPTHHPRTHLPTRPQATRRVERVEVNYSRAAKQVDVRSLKELMWHGMHSAAPDGAPPSPDTVLGFQVGECMQGSGSMCASDAAATSTPSAEPAGPLPWLTPAPHSAPL